MNTCALARVLWPAFLVGVLVGSVSRSDTWGWAAAGVTVATIWAIGKVRRTASAASCAIPVTTEPPSAGQSSTC